MFCFQVLRDVTAVEFVTFVGILSSLPSMNTLLGRQQLLDIVIEQADLNSPFDVRWNCFFFEHVVSFLQAL